ncbi:hypothetical protein ACJMK2_031528, partial [Sinanodonta woodiana]
DINELQEKNLALEILMASLDEYVTSKKQNIHLDIPSAVQSDPMFLLELGQVKRIAEGFEEKK